MKNRYRIISPLSLINFFLKRWRFFVLAVLTSGLLIAGYNYYAASAGADEPFNKLPNEYTGTVKIFLVSQSDDPLKRIRTSYYGDPSGKLIVNPEDIVFTDQIYNDVIKQLKVRDDIKKPLTVDSLKMNTAYYNYTYTARENKDLYFLEYSDTDPVTASVIANTIADELGQWYQEKFKEEIDYEVLFYKNRLKDLERDILQHNQRIVQFEKKNGIAYVDVEQIMYSGGGILQVRDVVIHDMVFTDFKLQEEIASITDEYYKLLREKIGLERLLNRVKSLHSRAVAESADTARPFQVLEYARPSNEITGPPRVKICISFVGITLLVSIILVLCAQYVSRLKKE